MVVGEEVGGMVGRWWTVVEEAEVTQEKGDRRQFSKFTTALEVIPPKDNLVILTSMI